MQQIGINVHDLEQAITFYQKLGFELQDTNPPLQARLVDASGTLLVLNVQEAHEAGVWIYLQVQDLQSMVGTLIEQGLVFQSMPEKKAWVWEEAYLDDMDGNHIVLYSKPDKGTLPPWKIH